MNLTKAILTLSTIISLSSCDKPEMDIETINRQDKLIKLDNTTSKSTTKFILEINDEYDVVTTTDEGHTIYGIQLWDGEELLELTTTYYFDQINSLVVDYADESFEVIMENEYKIIKN